MHRASSEAASLTERRLLSPAHSAETDRQTRRRKETPTPLLYLCEGCDFSAQSECCSQIQSAMSSCCCRCCRRKADV